MFDNHYQSTALPALKPGSLPVLYYRAKKGALHQWRIWVEGDTIFTEYGQVGGKQQRTPGKTCVAMNVGQSNERNPEVQALAVAASMHKFKLDRKYSLTPEGATDAKDGLPMLAHPFEDRSKHIVFPADVQPKLDGNRAAGRWQGGAVELVSRSGVKTYELPHIQEALAKVLPQGCEFDGELYVHGEAPQTINSWTAGEYPNAGKLEYWIYDMPMHSGSDALSWSVRRRVMESLLHNCPLPLRCVPTQRVDDLAQATHFMQEWLGHGYEGAIIRNLAGTYDWGNRSNDLQKLKLFQDSEFEIVGCTQGVGKMAGCAIWECRVPATAKVGAGLTFTCSMKAPMAERQRQYTERAKYIGKQMTVSYFGTFDAGTPRFPRAVKFRSPEDT